MKTNLKHWFVKSAVLDFQNGNQSWAGILIILWMSYTLDTYLWGTLIFSIILWTLLDIYHSYWRKYYHFYICEIYWVKPKTLNITFKR